MDYFKPSVDWAQALGPSLLFVLIAVVASAASVALIGFLLIRFSQPGQRFWRITGDYFTGRSSLRVWGTLAVLLVSVIVEVRLEVLQSFQGNDVYTALQTAIEGASRHRPAERAAGMHGFWVAIGVFCILATLHIARIVFDTWLTQRFIIAWRVWLTGRLSADWLSGRSYYRGRFAEPKIDNPDQRIQQDIDVFTAGVGTGPNLPWYYSQSVLLFGAIEAVVSVASFTVVCWNLSGPLNVFGLQIPNALFWIVILYVLIVTIIAFRIGRPLIGRSFRNEQTNAAFRYALVRLRDSAEAVAFYRGEQAEGRELNRRFSAIIANYRAYVRRTLGLVGWNYSATEAVYPIPLVVQAPRLFTGAIKLGDLRQSAQAFGKILSGLSFFRNAYSQLASYDAVMIRLDGLIECNRRSRELPTLPTEASPDDSVVLDGVEVRTPSGELLINPVDLRLDPSESMVVTGASGTGKTTLLRSLAELWPAATGSWSRPAGDHQTMFLSQMPYVPLGDLRTVVSYPANAGDIDDERLRDVLGEVFLPHLRDRLDDKQDWAKVLSPGEQQRIAFARVLLTGPKAAFFDEATSALDEGLELALYELVHRQLPDTILVSVSHHAAVVGQHQQRLDLVGDGAWRLSPVASAQ